MSTFYLDLFKSPACSMQLGGSQRVLQRPRTFAKAFGQRRVGYPYASRPQKQRLCYTVKGDVAVVSSIGGLNSSGSPCTVVGVVPLVYSAPFYGVPRTWPRPNIRNEVGKVEPPITDSDTSTAVITVRDMLRVSATLYHTSPHHVLWRGAASACMTVPQSSLSRLFGTKTATTSSRTALQEICRNYHRVTAGALTQPRSAADQRHTAADISWKFLPNNLNRRVHYPMAMSIAKIAVAANVSKNITIWTRRDNINIKGILSLAGGQIAGVPTDVEVACEPSINTWVQSGSLTFTPTEKGVVEINFKVYDGIGTTNNFWIDDLEIT